MRSTAGFLFGLLMSVAVLLAGLWMTLVAPDPAYAPIGWLLLLLGLVFLGVNVALRRYTR
jgi:hypothetical protein